MGCSTEGCEGLDCLQLSRNRIQIFKKLLSVVLPKVYFLLSLLDILWIVYTHFPAVNMLFEERLHSIECRIVFEHLFRCSMCKSHGMLAPILPLVLMVQDHRSWCASLSEKKNLYEISMLTASVA